MTTSERITTTGKNVDTNTVATVRQFPGINHVAVTVSDLERSTRWYSALFDTVPVLDED
ncbi:MAG: glyoxylase family protein, partial [Pseudonocardiales bacterium]|nr:glyoxylase family protein [Pseudonocardiales bacterium]